jgi:ribonuclease-3 family protein
MLFSGKTLAESEAQLISPRLLAHLGDAVFHLYERERQLVHQNVPTVSHLHKITTERTNAAAQAQLLDTLQPHLSAAETDVVRRARNIKPQRQHRSDQGIYRKSTAFEALLGYLYLTQPTRLKQLLEWSLPNNPAKSSGRRLPES